jgi:hypothetical protein
MRQYHKKCREAVVGTDRRKDQPESTALLEKNEDTEAATREASASSGTTTVARRTTPKSVQFVSENPKSHANSMNPRNRRTSVRPLGPASHFLDSHARLQLPPRLLEESIRPGPTPPFAGASQMDTASLKLVRFRK